MNEKTGAPSNAAGASDAAPAIGRDTTSGGEPDARDVAAGTPQRTKAALLPTKPMGGAVGAGLALVVLPSLALLTLGLPWNEQMQSMPSTLVLAMVAIFGIMILLGALALVSTLFARLDLADAGQAMGLPAGSVRAFIALALIVLFALISVMLYQCVSQTYRIDNLTDTERAALVKDPSNRVTAIIPHVCSRGMPPPCAADATLYTAYVRQAPSSESTDLAKQLLILIGTLMTSVTSFYFASRAGDATTKTAMAALASHLTGKNPDNTQGDDGTSGGGSGGAGNTNAGPNTNGAGGNDNGADGKPGGGTTSGSQTADKPPPGMSGGDADDVRSHAGVDSGDDHPDGCDVAVETATADKDLPASVGGVAS